MGDLDANLVAWSTSQMQEANPQINVDRERSYNWEQLLRWKSQGPDSPGLQYLTPRVVSMTDAWLWMLLYPPRPERTYTYPHQLLALPHHTNTTPLGLGITEEGSLCTCFSLDLAAWTVVEEFEGGNLTLTQADVDCYHPHRYPDLNLAVVLDLSQAGDTCRRHAQDIKQCNHYNAWCVYRAQRLHIITIRPVR